MFILSIPEEFEYFYPRVTLSSRERKKINILEDKKVPGKQYFGETAKFKYEIGSKRTFLINEGEESTWLTYELDRLFKKRLDEPARASSQER